MISAKSPRQVLSFTSRTQPALLDGGSSIAWVSPGEDGVNVAHVDQDAVSPAQVAVPQLAAQVDPALDFLELTGQLLVRWSDKGGSSLAVVRAARGSPLPREAAPALRVPKATVRVLSVSAEQGSVVSLEERGIGRYGRGQTRESLAAFKAPLLAYGYLHGRWYALDRAGNLYQYGSPLLPASLGHVDVGAAAKAASSETMTVVAAAVRGWSAIRAPAGRSTSSPPR